MDYTQRLKDTYGSYHIMLVKHDPSLTGLPCYIEVTLPSMPKKLKDKQALVLDLGNYLYRVLGLSYQQVPEFRLVGKVHTIRWFMSWDDVAPLILNIQQALRLEASIPKYSLPIKFTSLVIQSDAWKAA